MRGMARPTDVIEKCVWLPNFWSVFQAWLPFHSFVFSPAKVKNLPTQSSVQTPGRARAKRTNSAPASFSPWFPKPRRSIEFGLNSHP